MNIKPIEPMVWPWTSHAIILASQVAVGAKLKVRWRTEEQLDLEFDIAHRISQEGGSE